MAWILLMLSDPCDFPFFHGRGKNPGLKLYSTYNIKLYTLVIEFFFTSKRYFLSFYAIKRSIKSEKNLNVNTKWNEKLGNNLLKIINQLTKTSLYYHKTDVQFEMENPSDNRRIISNAQTVTPFQLLIKTPTFAFVIDSSKYSSKTIHSFHFGFEFFTKIIVLMKKIWRCFEFIAIIFPPTMEEYSTICKSSSHPENIVGNIPHKRVILLPHT